MDGTTLIRWGFTPGPWFKTALAEAGAMQRAGASDDAIHARMLELQPVEAGLRTNSLDFATFLTPATEDERANLAAVTQHMDQLMRVPTIRAGAVMPDACPSGSAPGMIPVGGVVACEDAIHPAFHSADICCSVAISVLKRRDKPGRVLDAAMKASHFGPGGRTDNGADRHAELRQLIAGFADNPFLAGLETRALHHFMTQGDGNHFFFVGELAGDLCIVNHHGSRGLGGDLYKRGKAAAERFTRVNAPGLPAHQAWIPYATDAGRAYWDALQIVRLWTRMNHYAIHDAVARLLGNAVRDRFWNEHNFVFRKADGLFYHAKGATPVFTGFSPDDAGLTLVPLNMRAGVLVMDHGGGFRPEPRAMGFAPHGAGRNLSRGAHVRRLTETEGDDPAARVRVVTRETEGIDARFYSGLPDLSELPSAYKDAAAVRADIDRFRLAETSAEIRALGSIMAGNDKRDWRNLRSEAPA